jgi:DNA-binding response OmpR family regulator
MWRLVLSLFATNERNHYFYRHMPNILVIEDDDIMLKAIRNILNKDGFNVVTAQNGKEAFEMLDTATYDIVLTDLMMPYANGLEVVSKIRNDNEKRGVGIIVVSSVGNEETITEAFRLGADDYLKKPIMAGELLIRIRKLLANKNSKTQFVTKKK